MLATAIIAKKRDCSDLDDNEIEFMIKGMLDGTIPDYQISAWAMAILCRGMSREEISALTKSMLESGGRLSRVSDKPRVDKHSTGGLGDKVSLILAPVLAACDIEVPMLSGRGLGITGGTLDKLESYPGFRCDLEDEEIGRVVESVGCVITGASPLIAPADRKLYGLRDVTGTVPSIALITASILSKKLAETLDAMVFDVKFGSGTFMKSQSQAQELASSLKNTSESLGLGARVVLSSMEQPLGHTVGNACEVNEAVQVLQGDGPKDVVDLTKRLCAELLESCGRVTTQEAASELVERVLSDGSALTRYIKMVEAQGGKYVDELPLEQSSEFVASTGGYLAEFDGELLGQAVIVLGGGRRTVEDRINHGVGIGNLAKIGTRVTAGQPIAKLFAPKDSRLDEAIELLRGAIKISDHPPQPLRLIIED